MMTARSITLRNSRTFPGHNPAVSQASSHPWLGGYATTVLFIQIADQRRGVEGMSCFRSRNGGNST